jgi:hypothetical protein
MRAELGHTLDEEEVKRVLSAEFRNQLTDFLAGRSFQPRADKSETQESIKA